MQFLTIAQLNTLTIGQLNAMDVENPLAGGGARSQRRHTLGIY